MLSIDLLTSEIQLSSLCDLFCIPWGLPSFSKNNCEIIIFFSLDSFSVLITSTLISREKQAQALGGMVGRDEKYDWGISGSFHIAS